MLAAPQERDAKASQSWSAAILFQISDIVFNPHKKRDPHCESLYIIRYAIISEVKRG